MHETSNIPKRSAIEESIGSAIRQIIRAADRQSRLLEETHGLTSPQIATLRAIRRVGSASTGRLAQDVRLSQPTITGILDRLERKGFITRSRSAEDRRSIFVSLTPDGLQAIDALPSVLHERFRYELARLPGWEQTMILATLQRIASMMSVESGGSSNQPSRLEADGRPEQEARRLRPANTKES